VESRLVELGEQDLRLTPAEAASLFEASGHLFITRLAEEPARRYLYHALFAEFLCRCLEQEEGAQAVQDWHRPAAHCLLEWQATATADRRTDEYIAAINHLLAGQDWTGAADAIETAAEMWTIETYALDRRAHHAVRHLRSVS
jgi:ATP/maltotriose-dependent transcriptional regulator MalT